MSDFCKQCSLDMFGEDLGDLADLSTPADTANGLFACVICEGCGFILVDHNGLCQSPDCIEHSKPGHGGVPCTNSPKNAA